MLGGWRLKPRLEAGPPPLKGLTDNPVYQWWRDPTIMQPDSWWCAAQDDEALAGQLPLMGELGARLFRVELLWRALARSSRVGYAMTRRRRATRPGRAIAGSALIGWCGWQARLVSGSCRR